MIETLTFLVDHMDSITGCLLSCFTILGFIRPFPTEHLSRSVFHFPRDPALLEKSLQWSTFDDNHRPHLNDSLEMKDGILEHLDERGAGVGK
jgi:hypothetical protein